MILNITYILPYYVRSGYVGLNSTSALRHAGPIAQIWSKLAREATGAYTPGFDATVAIPLNWYSRYTALLVRGVRLQRYLEKLFLVKLMV